MKGNPLKLCMFKKMKRKRIIGQSYLDNFRFNKLRFYLGQALMLTRTYLQNAFVGCQRLALQNFLCDLLFLATVVEQMALDPVRCPVEIHCAAVLPCEMAKFQGGG